MNLQLSVESEILGARVTGMFSLAEAKTLFMEILEAAAQNKVRKVLMDVRELNGKPSVFERFDFNVFAAGAVTDYMLRGLSRPLCFAYAFQAPFFDPRKLGEDVAKNRGMMVKYFDNLDDARAWLGIKSSELSSADVGTVRARPPGR